MSILVFDVHCRFSEMLDRANAESAVWNVNDELALASFSSKGVKCHY